jgi:hypothetical protein
MRTEVQAGWWVPVGPTGPKLECATHVRWRSLTREECRRIAALPGTDIARWCAVYEACRVEGPSLEEVPAGIVAWIGKQQFENNPFFGGFESIRNALYQARHRVESSWYASARAVLASTFRYSFEEIDGWPPEIFFERVAQAEMLTGVPLEPADPNAKKKPPRGQRTQRTPAPATEKHSGNVDRRPQIDIEENTWTSARR